MFTKTGGTCDAKFKTSPRGLELAANRFNANAVSMVSRNSMVVGLSGDVIIHVDVSRCEKPNKIDLVAGRSRNFWRDRSECAVVIVASDPGPSGL